ncbi:MAG TPA: glycosyltransferase family 2 protein [Pirellulales bacterium]
MPPRFLTALPVYNEARHVTAVLDEVRKYSQEILVVDDGSTDGTSQLLAQRPDVHVVRHPRNRGYGAGLSSAFDFALANQYDLLVTIDCDGQHEPKRIPEFVAACDGWDVVSGSRYLQQYPEDSQPPADRRRINELLTAEINRRLGLSLTDAFCGFKAYRVAALGPIQLHEAGYAMPLEFWVQAVQAGLRIRELPVPLIYLEEERSFGGSLDNAETRLRYYREVLDRAAARTRPPGGDREASLCGKTPPGGWTDHTTGPA